jgi:hypothetical protein
MTFSPGSAQKQGLQNRAKWALRNRGSHFYRLVRPRRFVLVSKRYSFVYFQVPKVATRSVLAALKELDPEAVELNKIPYTPGMFRGLRSFGVVRDPFERLHSYWANKVRDSGKVAECYPHLRGMTFAAFVDEISAWDLRVCDAHARFQSRLVPRNVDFVARFERLDTDIERLTSWLEIPALELPVRNVSNRGPTAVDEYGPDLQRRVRELYAVDMKRFGYLVS